MADPCSTRTWPSRWRCGTCGRVIAARAGGLRNRLRPGSCSTGGCWPVCARGIDFATLTHAAGISSTGDAALDARLPFDEAYHVPSATVNAIERALARGGRVVALGTTVTRALEHAASRGLNAGDGVADQRIGAHTTLRVVDAIISGTH